jgi:type I restriction enzyme R subunit
MPRRGSETEFEATTIDRLMLLGHRYEHGSNIARSSRRQVVLHDELRAFLTTRYPDLPAGDLAQAVDRITRPDGVDTLRRNKTFHGLLTEGFNLRVEHADGQIEDRHIYAIDWEYPDRNRFLVVNQLEIEGKNDRRPDIVLFVNGLPLVVLELKNPYAAEPTVEEAHNQIQHYAEDIGQLFDLNGFCVVSDGVTSLHGMWTSPLEWYAPWKSIDGFNVEPRTTGSMKTLVEGLLTKDRLLAYLRSFIVFEEENTQVTKKGAKYHQFFAVRLASAKAVAAMAEGADQRVGVIWHTTGSGKSLSMVFLVGVLRQAPELANPTFVIEVDRNDLDDQLHDQFLRARQLVGPARQAESVDDLREALRTQGGGIVLTTIEKFRVRPDDDVGQHPVLSTRRNIVVIADEAHRSQYGFLKGYARYLADALPNARRIGFTGTPVSLHGADTVEVFGELIHTYTIGQAQEDKATVPIFYTARQAKLHLTHADVTAALGEITTGQAISDLERRKSRWAALAQVAMAEERVGQVAADLLVHFLDRMATLEGKGLIVCMTRTHCVRLYDALTALPGCPEVKIVMTGNLGVDPAEWSRDGHITTKKQREKIKDRMVDPADPLKLVIVCDMWLTGTDIPCLHTLYVDKPMRGHNIIQAISRVNRVFRDKPHGMIVDYIGIGEELREATAKYTRDGDSTQHVTDIETTAKPVFFKCLEEVLKLLPSGQPYDGWRQLSGIAYEDLFALVYGTLTEEDGFRDQFLEVEERLSLSFLLVKHLADCRAHADEVIFCQRVRNQLLKTLPGQRLPREVETAVRDLVDDSVASDEIVDIFKAAGIDQPDVSIIDDAFLQTWKDRPFPNLRLKLLEQLINDEIGRVQRKNLARARSFHELLRVTLERYHARLIDAAAVIREIIRIRDELREEEQRARALGLADEDLAFYDAIAANFGTIYDHAFLSGLIHDVVQTIKRNLKVDWTEPHRDDVRAEVRSAVRRVLRKKGVKAQDLEPFVTAVIRQAEESYREWPLAA